MTATDTTPAETAPHELHGIVQMTNDEYHAAPGISKSKLDDIADCPLRYWQRHINPEREPEEPTASLVLGDAIHTAVLEPDSFASRYMVMPPFNLRSPKGREERDHWLATEAKGASVLTVDQRDTALAAATAVRRHPMVSRLLTGGAAEQSYFVRCRRTGALKKCRLDYFHEGAGLIVDLKSTDDASPAAFSKSVHNYRYHVQQGWYQREVLADLWGEAPPHWAFVALEKAPPYAIGVYYLEPEDVDRGVMLARRNLETLLECQRTDVWPDYASAGAMPLPMPGWARREADSRLGVL